MIMPNEKIIDLDLEKIIADKNPKLLNIIPGFFMRYLKRILHIKELNEILSLSKDEGFEGVEFAEKVLDKLQVSYEIHNKYSLDKSKRYIFVSNHPLGGLDGLIHIASIGKIFGDIKFVVRDELLNIAPLESVFIPINKYGKMNNNYANRINNAFKSDSQILFFPAGLCSRLNKGKIKDLDWKKTFINKAKEYDRDIVPIYFEGRNSMFFYRLAKLRKFLHIKFNIETFYLVNEMFKQKNSKFDIYYDKPIKSSSITTDHSLREWAQIIKNKVYTIKSDK